MYMLRLYQPNGALALQLVEGSVPFPFPGTLRPYDYAQIAPILATIDYAGTTRLGGKKLHAVQAELAQILRNTSENKRGAGEVLLAAINLAIELGCDVEIMGD